MNITDAKAVFFDWDGTLVDSFLFLHRAHNHVREVLGIEPFSIEVFQTYFGQPREKLYTQLYGEHREEAKKHFEAFVLENHAKDLKPINGASDVLEWFYTAGIPCGVVTNKKGSLVRAEIKAFGWDHYFQTVVGAGEAEADKPSPAPLLMAIEQANLKAANEEIWYIGDTDNDLKCANAASCPSIFIESTAEKERLLADHEINLHFESCESFYDFLLQSGVNSLKAKTSG